MLKISISAAIRHCRRRLMCVGTGSGNIFMNIAMRYGRRRRSDPKPG